MIDLQDEILNKLSAENECEKHALNQIAVSKRLFLCDICGEQKSGKKFPILDENYNKQIGLNQCQDCFKKACGIN